MLKIDPKLSVAEKYWNRKKKENKKCGLLRQIICSKETLVLVCYQNY